MPPRRDRPWYGLALGLALSACSGPRGLPAEDAVPPVALRADAPAACSAEALRGEVVAALDRDRLSEALAAVDRVLALTPADARAHAMRAVLLSFQERHAEATEAWGAALERTPERNDWRFHRLQALFTCGRYEEAAGEYERLVTSDLATLDASVAHTLVTERAGWAEAAFLDPRGDDGFEGWTWLPPGRVAGLKSAHDLGGWSLLYAGRLAGGLRAFDRLREYAPWDYRGHEGAGWTLHLLGREAEAAVAFAHARELEPGVARRRRDIGLEHLASGRQDQASMCFDLALALDPRGETLRAAPR